MKRGLGVFLWQISVALYLFANGVLGVQKSGVLKEIIGGTLKGNVDVLIIIAGVIAIIAGVAVLLDLLDAKILIADSLVLIIAIIWAVFVVLQIVGWVGDGFKDFWVVLSKLSVNVIILASLLTASKKFG